MAATSTNLVVARPEAGGATGRHRSLNRWLAPQFLWPMLGVAIGALLVLGPFVATVVRSLLVESGEVSRWTLANFAAVFGDPRFHRALGNTLLISAGATLASCGFGLVLAWIVARTDAPARKTIDTLNVVPFFMSPFVGAMSWIYLAAPNSGMLNQIIAQWFGGPDDFLNIYSLGGAIWVLTLFYTPYVYLFVIGPMRSMDPSLEDAARVHGAGFWSTTRHVTAPLVLPALLSGALIVFVTSAGLFDVPLALIAPHGKATIPTQVFSFVQYPTDYGRAAAVGVSIMTVTILLSLFQRRWLGRRSFTTISGKGYRPSLTKLGRWKPVAMAFEAFYVVNGVVLPLAALLLVSLSRLWTGWPQRSQFTLYNYQEVLFNHEVTRRAISNSLLVAFIGATLGVGLALLQAYFLVRSRSRAKPIVDAMLALPLGIPGIVLGLGVLILLIKTPLYATLWIILIAYIARFFPFATRTVWAMLLSMSADLEESARANGATWLQTMRYVVLPLLRPAIVAAWLMLFVIFIRELGASILIYVQGTETISVAMVVLGEQSFGFVAALAIIQTLFLGTAFALSRRTGASLMGN